MQVAITIDFEHDCPPYLETYRGIEQGTPRLLESLEAHGIRATFFCTGDVARRYPRIVGRILDAGHELGCHGDTHRRFSGLSLDEARNEISRATETLRRFYPVSSFRAPNLDLPRSCVLLLRDAGYSLDSSQGRHKLGSYFVAPHVVDDVWRIAASTSPLVLRLPEPVRDALLSCLKSPVVLYAHPWEFIDVTKENIRVDCRWGTGEAAVRKLDTAIEYFQRRGAEFATMAELPAKLAIRTRAHATPEVSG